MPILPFINVTFLFFLAARQLTVLCRAFRLQASIQALVKVREHNCLLDLKYRNTWIQRISKSFWFYISVNDLVYCC